MTLNQRLRCTARNRLLRGSKKKTAAELASQQVAAAVEDGWRLVYVDGSSKPLWKGGKYRVGGLGISQEDTQTRKISILELLPPDLQQTNNVAELWGGGVKVLKRIPGNKLAILSDSIYLISGAQGHVHSWREMSWIGSRGEMISKILIWEEMLLEMERPGRIVKWIYVLGHAGLEGNDTAHRLAVEGMCLNTLWALPRTAFSRLTYDTQTAHEQSPRPAATSAPENMYAVIGVEDNTNSSPNDHPGAIWLSLGLVEMSEPEEGAS